MKIFGNVDNLENLPEHIDKQAIESYLTEDMRTYLQTLSSQFEWVYESINEEYIEIPYLVSVLLANRHDNQYLKEFNEWLATAELWDDSHDDRLHERLQKYYESHKEDEPKSWAIDD